MAKSLKQVQDELLTSGYLDTLADDPVDPGSAPTNTAVSDLIIKLAGEFVIAVQENLDRLGKVSTGGLTDGVSAGDLLQSGSTYTLEIGYDKNDPSAKYWDFVNKGVRGIRSGQPASSPYQFRKLSAPPVMVEAIKGWLRVNGIAARNEDQREDLSRLQQKRRNIAAEQDPQGDFAYAIALAIKRRGLPYTGYFDQAVNAYFGKTFAQAVAKAASFDVRVAVRKFNPAQNA
jgi:hypothetical protein